MVIIEKIGIGLSILLIVAVLGLIVFSKNGILDYRELKRKQAALQNQVKEVDLKNKVLEKEIIRLKTDMAYIKHIAKHEHDMSAEDELIFKDKPAVQGGVQ